MNQINDIEMDIERQRQSMTKSPKTTITPFIIAFLVSSFVGFHNPIINRITPNYTVIVKNLTNMDLNDLSIETTQGDNILKFSSAKGSINTYKITKKKVLSDTAYYIVYKNADTIQSSELLVSFDEKYDFKRMSIAITKEPSTGDIEFRILSKKNAF